MSDDKHRIINYTPVAIVLVDDWAALYCGNESVCQGHTIRLHDLKTYLPNYITLGMIHEIWLDGTSVEQWAFDNGRLPEYRSELIKIWDEGVNAVY